MSSGQQQLHFQAASQLVGQTRVRVLPETRLSHPGGQYSHTTQALLMRTLPPAGGPDSTSRGDGSREAGDTAAVARKDGQLDEGTKSRKGSTEESDSSPRRYLMRRNRSRAVYGYPRMASKRLPFETVPGNGERHSVSWTVRVSCDEVERCMVQLAARDAYVCDGRLGAGLPLEDMTEAQLVEERLRGQVKSWMAKAELGGSGLQAADRGQGQAEGMLRKWRWPSDVAFRYCSWRRQLCVYLQT